MRSGPRATWNPAWGRRAQTAGPPEAPDPGTLPCAPGVPRRGLGCILAGLGGRWVLTGSRRQILVTGSGVFGVLGPGQPGRAVSAPRPQRVPRPRPRGAPRGSAEDPQAPQSLAAAEQVAGARGAVPRWLPAETGGRVRAEAAADGGLWPLLLPREAPGRGRRGGGEPSVCTETCSLSPPGRGPEPRPQTARPRPPPRALPVVTRLCPPGHYLSTLLLFFLSSIYFYLFIIMIF